MTPKEKQKQHLINLMRMDEEAGLYDDTTKNLTAVEWLVEQLKEYGWADIKDSQNWVIKIDALVLTAKVEQAKAMEKEQIVNAWMDGRNGMHTT
jgi:hypothetical protein